jgi:hypothetical protein
MFFGPRKNRAFIQDELQSVNNERELFSYSSPVFKNNCGRPFQTYAPKDGAKLSFSASYTPQEAEIRNLARLRPEFLTWNKDGLFVGTENGLTWHTWRNPDLLIEYVAMPENPEGGQKYVLFDLCDAATKPNAVPDLHKVMLPPLLAEHFNNLAEPWNRIQAAKPYDINDIIPVYAASPLTPSYASGRIGRYGVAGSPYAPTDMFRSWKSGAFDETYAASCAALGLTVLGHEQLPADFQTILETPIKQFVTWRLTGNLQRTDGGTYWTALPTYGSDDLFFIKKYLLNNPRIEIADATPADVLIERLSEALGVNEYHYEYRWISVNEVWDWCEANSVPFTMYDVGAPVRVEKAEITDYRIEGPAELWVGERILGWWGEAATYSLAANSVLPEGHPVAITFRTPNGLTKEERETTRNPIRTAYVRFVFDAAATDWIKLADFPRLLDVRAVDPMPTEWPLREGSINFANLIGNRRNVRQASSNRMLYGFIPMDEFSNYAEKYEIISDPMMRIPYAGGAHETYYECAVWGRLVAEWHFSGAFNNSFFGMTMPGERNFGIPSWQTPSRIFRARMIASPWLPRNHKLILSPQNWVDYGQGWIGDNEARQEARMTLGGDVFPGTPTQSSGVPAFILSADDGFVFKIEDYDAGNSYELLIIPNNLVNY